MALAISLSYSASVEMAAMSFKSSSWSSCPSLPASCLSRWSTWLYRRLSPVHLGHLLVHHGHSQEVWSGLPPSLLLFGTNPPPNCIPPLKDFSSIQQVALHGFKVFCQVVTMLSLRSSKGGQKWSIKRSPSYSKEVPKLLTTEVMKTGKRKFHLQIDFFYSLDEFAVDLILLFVHPFCPINRLTDSSGMPLVTLSCLKNVSAPPFLHPSLFPPPWSSRTLRPQPPPTADDQPWQWARIKFLDTRCSPNWLSATPSPPLRLGQIKVIFVHHF